VDDFVGSNPNNMTTGLPTADMQHGDNNNKLYNSAAKMGIKMGTKPKFAPTKREIKVVYF
jgi:hypothetical protein